MRMSKKRSQVVVRKQSGTLNCAVFGYSQSFRLRDICCRSVVVVELESIRWVEEEEQDDVNDGLYEIDECIKKEMVGNPFCLTTSSNQ